MNDQTTRDEQPATAPVGYVSPFQTVGHDGPCHDLKTGGRVSGNLGFAIESSILRWAATRLRSEQDQYGPERSPGIATAVDRLGEWAEDASVGTPEVGYGCIHMERTLGKGVRVTAAPQRSNITLEALLAGRFSLSVQGGDQLLILDQVLYQIVGYNSVACALELALIEDYRPGAAPQFADVDAHSKQATDAEGQQP